MKKLVWNGCDGYVEADEAVRRGYDFDGTRLHHGQKGFDAFAVTELACSEIPVGEDGEIELMDGFYISETGRCYKMGE